MQKVYIKGMVCERCISTVKNELESIGFEIEDIRLGEVTISVNSEMKDSFRIEEKLRPLGFSLLEDKRIKLVKDVKRSVEEVYSGDFDFPNHFRFSLFVTEKLQKEYDLISSIFSALEKITLEKYIIEYRIEKVKEFLVYTNQTLADISFRLGFSSVAHLSRQFKTITGFNPSHFKLIRMEKEKITSNPSR